MKNFVSDLVYAPVTAIWNEKIVRAQKSTSVAVNLNKFEVEGDASGSPWLV